MQDTAFQKLLKEAREVEYQIMLWYKNNVDPKSRMAIPKTKGFDIICPKVNNVEVKQDKLACKTGNYALEIEDRFGQASGLAATTAGDFVIVDDDYVLFTKTTSLLFVIKDCDGRRIIHMGETDKNNRRGLGYLIPRHVLLHSPYVNLVKRWF
jgi:hypothetical protein